MFSLEQKSIAVGCNMFFGAVYGLCYPYKAQCVYLCINGNVLGKLKLLLYLLLPRPHHRSPLHPLPLLPLQDLPHRGLPHLHPAPQLHWSRPRGQPRHRSSSSAS